MALPSQSEQQYWNLSIGKWNIRYVENSQRVKFLLEDPLFGTDGHECLGEAEMKTRDGIESF